MLVLALILLATLPLFPGNSARSISSPQEVTLASLVHLDLSGASTHDPTGYIPALLQVMYSDFRKLTADGFVKSVRIDESANQIYFNVPVPPQEQQKRTWIPGRRRATPQQAAPSGILHLSMLEEPPRHTAWFL